MIRRRVGWELSFETSRFNAGSNAAPSHKKLLMRFGCHKNIQRQKMRFKEPFGSVLPKLVFRFQPCEPTLDNFGRIGKYLWPSLLGSKLRKYPHSVFIALFGFQAYLKEISLNRCDMNTCCACMNPVKRVSPRREAFPGEQPVRGGDGEAAAAPEGEHRGDGGGRRRPTHGGQCERRPRWSRSARAGAGGRALGGRRATGLDLRAIS